MNARTITRRSLLVLLVSGTTAAVVTVPDAAGTMIASSANGLTLTAIGAVPSAVMPQIAGYQADEDPSENQPPPAASQPPGKSALASSLDRAGTMITSSPSRQLTGVATL